MSGWHVGLNKIGMGSGVLGGGSIPAGQVFAFHDSEYGVFSYSGTLTLYKVLPNPASITGYTLYFLPSTITYDQGSIGLPLLALNATTLVFQERISTGSPTSDFAIRILTRSADTIAMSASQQTISVYEGFHRTTAMVRVSDTTFARSYASDDPSSPGSVGSTVIQGCSVSGSTVSISSTSTLARSTYPPSPIPGNPTGAATLSDIVHYGAGKIIGTSVTDFSFPNIVIFGLDFTVAGGVTAATAHQFTSAGGVNYLFLDAIEGSADTLWLTSFSFVGDVTATPSGGSFSDVLYSDYAYYFPASHANLTGTTGYVGVQTSGTYPAAKLQYAVTTQSGTSLAVATPLTDTAFTSDNTPWHSMALFSQTAHSNSVIVAIVEVGTSTSPVDGVLPVAFPI